MMLSGKTRRCCWDYIGTRGTMDLQGANPSSDAMVTLLRVSNARRRRGILSATTREAQMRWLWSPDAIKAHLVFPLVIALASYELLTGNQAANELQLALVFCGFAYPTVLFLSWLKWRCDWK
jgi:hypothetical protein